MRSSTRSVYWYGCFGKRPLCPRPTRKKHRRKLTAVWARRKWRLTSSLSEMTAIFSYDDLSEVISQTEEDSESYLVNLVENFVRRYVEQPNSDILLSLLITDNAFNSSTDHTIPNAKQRRLDVLTQPERRTSHGYHIFPLVLFNLASGSGLEPGCRHRRYRLVHFAGHLAWSHFF